MEELSESEATRLKCRLAASWAFKVGFFTLLPRLGAIYVHTINRNENCGQNDSKILSVQDHNVPPLVVASDGMSVSVSVSFSELDFIFYTFASFFLGEIFDLILIFTALFLSIPTQQRSL